MRSMQTNSNDERGVWQARAAMWELLAFSLRYPDAELAEAVASGEWADACLLYTSPSPRDTR